MTADLQSYGREQFVALTTFRRNGTGVTTPVWIAPALDPDPVLVVTTTETTGKVKRIRHDGRVTIVPCSRTGTVQPGAVPVEGYAVVADDPSRDAAYHAALQSKYGLVYRIFMLAERLPFVRRRPARRVYLLIRTPESDGPGSDPT